MGRYRGGIGVLRFGPQTPPTYWRGLLLYGIPNNMGDDMKKIPPTDLRQIVRDRFEELKTNVATVSAMTGISRTTLYDLLRDPEDMEDYADGKTRLGNLNSDALGKVF